MTLRNMRENGVRSLAITCGVGAAKTVKSASPLRITNAHYSLPSGLREVAGGSLQLREYAGELSQLDIRRA